MPLAHQLSWIEISRDALANNAALFRSLVCTAQLSAVVKSNAYGHGIEACAPIFDACGIDWFTVNAGFEAARVRALGITKPIYIAGALDPAEMSEVLHMNEIHVVVYDRLMCKTLNSAGRSLQKKIPVHMKVETGCNRQGVLQNDLLAFAAFLRSLDFIQLVGLATHFANIEDTTDHTYAKKQISSFNESAATLRESGYSLKILQCANSAATLLFPEIHFDLVRVGISLYGLWPSPETRVALSSLGWSTVLRPALHWRAKVVQVKTIPKGSFVGYGCNFQASRETVLAVLPVGYYDGYLRQLSGKSYVLLHGQRAPLLGRVCMNMIMLDVTDISGVKVGDIATLLGRDGEESISAEQFGQWADTINYEVATLPKEHLQRVVV